MTADAEGLAGSVKNTCDLSERVSIKVRELDSAQVRSRAPNPKPCLLSTAPNADHLSQ